MFIRMLPVIMKNCILLTIFGILLVIPAIQAQNEHLEPVESIFDEYDFRFEYYSLVREVLMNGLSDTPEVRFLIIPSFAVEEVVAIEERKGKYYIVHHKMQNSIWYTEKNKDKIKVLKKAVEISKADMQLYHELFKVAVKNKEYPEQEILGFDGVNYYFSAKNDENNKLRTGTTWSPSEKSKIGGLTNIGKSLIKLAESTDEDKIAKLETKLTEQIKKLTIELGE